jgi:hypothetical protein
VNCKKTYGTKEKEQCFHIKIFSGLVVKNKNPQLSQATADFF